MYNFAFCGGAIIFILLLEVRDLLSELKKKVINMLYKKKIVLLPSNGQGADIENHCFCVVTFFAT